MVVNNNPDLTNSYGNLESFRSNKQKTKHVATVPVEQTPDRIEISKEQSVNTQQNEIPTEKPKKKKRGIIQSFKNIIAGAKKFGIAVAEYTVATAKGLVYGTIAAAGVLGIDAGIGITNIIRDPKEKSPVTNASEKITKKAGKIISKKGIFGAIAAGLSVLGYHWFRASLDISQRSAAVDHRWGSGHDEVIR